MKKGKKSYLDKHVPSSSNSINRNRFFSGFRLLNQILAHSNQIRKPFCLPLENLCTNNVPLSAINVV
ncbi:hypothetical protein V6N13_073451 [Hibiscus sabdariffa]